MEKRIFYSFRFSHLSNDDASSLIKSTVEDAIPVRTQLGDMANAILDELLPGAEKFRAQVNAQYKSKSTEQVVALDKKNDALLAEIKGNVVYACKSRDADKKAKAHELDFFFTPFWGASKKAIKTQAEDIEDMFIKLHADQSLLDAATLVGTVEPLTELESSNRDLILLYKTRNEEVGGRADSGSDLRPVVEQSYSQFCNAIELAVNYMPTDALVTLFNNMDAYRRKFSLLASDSNEKPTDSPKA